MDTERLRQIRLKTGVLKRLAKEKIVYEREVEEQKARIERLRAEGKDDYVLRKEEEVLTEAHMMVPDVIRRLGKFLNETLEYLEGEDDLKDSQEYKLAEEAIARAREGLAST